MYKKRLSVEGYDVCVANNGLEGIKIIKKEKPDLVLLDLVMPVIDGYQVIEKIEKDEDIKYIKICILSNLSQSNQLRENTKVKLVGYLVKSNLTPTQLIRDIKKMIKGENINVIKNNQVKKIKEEKKLNILFIEDDVDILEMYSLCLKKEGYNLEIARNGAWGMKMAKKKKYDIIVMDMVMPAMSGYDMLEQIKENSENMDTEIIVLSNSAQDADINKALDAGASCYLLKSSIKPSRLIEEIKIRI